MVIKITLTTNPVEVYLWGQNPLFKKLHGDLERAGCQVGRFPIVNQTQTFHSKFIALDPADPYTSPTCEPITCFMVGPDKTGQEKSEKPALSEHISNADEANQYIKECLEADGYLVTRGNLKSEDK